MTSRINRRALRVASCRVAGVLACAFALAACNQKGPAHLSAAHPRGATIAFESIDGPPSRQFQQLVQNLNEEAQTRRLAVISRDQPSAYRVRGYLAAKVVRDRTTIAWVWDVFDGDERRALRVSGEETAKGRHSDAWNAVDDAMLQRIARTSMDQLAAFLTSPDVAPGSAPAEAAQVAYTGPSASSPEAAGIFRIFRPQADPVDAKGAVADSPAAAPPADDTAVPVPRRRPTRSAALSPHETLALR